MGQSMEKGNILFDVGGGFGTYYTQLTTDEDEFIDEDAAVPVYFDVNARYALSKRFAIGLNMDFGSYLRSEQDELDYPGTFTYTKICASFRYVPLNKDIFQLFTDVNLGVNALTFSGEGFESAAGLHAQLNAGLNIYFGENSPVGYYLMGGLSTYTLNGEIENSDLGYRWYFIGANFQMGATLRF